MCIIILNKKDNILKNDVLINAFNNNNNGAGFTYIDPYNRLIIDKGYFNLDDFLKTYENIKQIAISDILIHCRVATHGGITADNCHPFFVDKNKTMALAHNGILSVTPKDNNQTDTKYFIDKYLQKLTIEALQSTFTIDILQSFIGANNKMVIFDKNGKSYILNEKYGKKDKQGNWYSNDSYTYTDYNFKYIKLSHKQCKKIKKDINNLTVNEMLSLTDNPYLNLNTLKLEPENTAKTNCIPLWQLDNIEIDNLYQEKYFDLIDIYTGVEYV